MKIRSITSFYDPNLASSSRDLITLSELSCRLRDKVNSELFPVQSTRLASIPFPFFLDVHNLKQTIDAIIQLEKLILQQGWDYLSLGPALPDHPESCAIIPEILDSTDAVFTSAIIAGPGQLYPSAIQATARVIAQNATLTSDGFTNLRFGAIANVPPNTPFLPAAYHKPGDPPAVSIAMECADIVLHAFQTSGSLDAARNKILNTFEKAAFEIEAIFNDIYSGTSVKFRGFDFSPAPFPQDWCSLGGAIESLASVTIGQAGSLAAAAIIADTLDIGKWKRSGFNGLMLPVMEDSVLALRAAEGTLSIKDLLLYSTVCGTGLDTIPLSGDTSAAVLCGVLYDVAALSVRLAKPLTARLMPIPGLKAGDSTQFHFDYFANSCTMNIDGQEINPLLSKEHEVRITPRKICS